MIEKVSGKLVKRRPELDLKGKNVPGTDTFETIVVTRIGHFSNRFLADLRLVADLND